MRYLYQEADVEDTCRPEYEGLPLSGEHHEEAWKTVLSSSSAVELLHAICDYLNDENCLTESWVRVKVEEEA